VGTPPLSKRNPKPHNIHHTNTHLDNFHKSRAVGILQGTTATESVHNRITQHKLRFSLIGEEQTHKAPTRCLQTLSVLVHLEKMLCVQRIAGVADRTLATSITSGVENPFTV
jgi:hypothetical protein